MKELRASRPKLKFKTKKEKPETGLHQRIKETMKLYPWADLERNNRCRRKGHLYGLESPGSSDFVGSVTLENGIARRIALEVKMPGEKPTREQQEYIDHVNAIGGYACVVRSVDEAVAAICEARKVTT